MRGDFNNIMINKVREFINREVSLTPLRYEEIHIEWGKVIDRKNKGEIDEETSNKKQKDLTEEAEKAEIKFAEEEEFKIFSLAFAVQALANFDKSVILKQVEHEIEHSQPYRKVGIPSYFGWHKFKMPGRFAYCSFHMPFGEKYEALSGEEKDRLKYICLNVVFKKSDSDKRAIERLEKRHSKEKCASWLSAYK